MGAFLRTRKSAFTDPPLPPPFSPDPHLIFQYLVLLVCHRNGEPIFPMQLRQKLATHDGKRALR